MAVLCPSPSPDLGLVQSLQTSVDCNVSALAEAGYGALSRPDSQIAVALTALLTIYIAFIGLRLMLGQAPLRVGDLTVTLVKIGVVLALATSWPTYQQVVFDTLFKGPVQLAGSMLSAIQPDGSVFRGDPFDALQTAYNEMQASAAFFVQRSNSLSSPFVGGPAFAAFALNISALITLLMTLGVALAARIVLAVLLGLGPIFVAMLLFDSTRGVFEGWLRASLAFAIAPLFAVLTLVVQLNLLEPHLIQLAVNRTEGVADMAPAVAVFTLTLVSSAVALAGIAAVAAIANGFRLPWAASPTATSSRVETAGTSRETSRIEVGETPGEKSSPKAGSGP